MAVLALAYLATGLVLALVAARRRARMVELLALLACWPLYAPLAFASERPRGDRMHVLGTALDRVGRIGSVAVTAADAPAWIARIDRAAGALVALDRAIGLHQELAAGDSPALARARTERDRRAEALTTIARLLDEVAAQVGLASWVDGADAELVRSLAAIDLQLAIADPAPAESAA